jgi:hypothetical protein
LVSYTFAKSIDNGSGAGGGAGTNGVINPAAPSDTAGILGNQLDNRANRGVSDFDRSHRFVRSWHWDLPKLAFARPLLAGWQVSGIVMALSGLPIDVVDTGAGSFYGLSGGSNPLARPNLVSNPVQAPAGLIFNPYAFGRPIIQVGQPIPSSGGTAIAGLAGTDIGNVGRNVLRGRRQANVDFASRAFFSRRSYEYRVPGRVLQRLQLGEFCQSSERPQRRHLLGGQHRCYFRPCPQPRRLWSHHCHEQQSAHHPVRRKA